MNQPITGRSPVEVKIPPGVLEGARSEPALLRCGVVGVGRMGRHHARVYSKLPDCRLVGVVDGDAERRETVAEAHGGGAFETVDQLLREGVDAVTIATPTVHHMACARPLLEAGVACLIEKPLASTVEEADELAQLAERTGSTLMVGHIERFNPAVRALQKARDEMLAAGLGDLAPRFIEVHRVSPMTFRSVDVSVVMDMMIHDLDVVLMLMGGVEPERVEASGVPVVTEHEDVCNARLTFDTPAGKCVANITASRLAFKTERKIRVVGEAAYVSIDYAKKAGVLVRKTANAIQLEEVREALRAGADLSGLKYDELVSIENLQIDDADQLEIELKTFLTAVREKSRPPIDARAGFAAVRTAQRIIESARRDWPQWKA